jgi:hypothetical protein
MCSDSHVLRKIPQVRVSHCTLDHREVTPEEAFSKGLRTMPLSGLEPSADSPEDLHFSPIPDAESDAVSENSPSPSLAILAKLVAGLTADERAALARMLGQGEGGE